MLIAFACTSSPVGSRLQPSAGQHIQKSLEVQSCRTHIRRITCSVFQQTLKGTGAVLLVTRPTSWRNRASPAAGCKPPATYLQAHRAAAARRHGVMCRRSRVDASGLGRGAAQSPWFSPSRGEKKKSRSSWLIGFSMQPSRHKRSEPGRPGAEAHPQCTIAARGLSPTLAQTANSLGPIPSILFLKHIQ